MTTSREAMQAALKSIVVPRLRTIAFKGSFPHFRRVVGDHIDLLTFQFDRNGGGFVIEISFCPTDGIATPWGEAIAPQRVTAWDVHPDKRYRIQPSKGAGTDSWFRFEDGGGTSRALIKCWNTCRLPKAGGHAMLARCPTHPSTRTPAIRPPPVTPNVELPLLKILRTAMCR